MEETVILTTLSTLQSRKAYSYYYVDDGEKRRYCDGLLSVEAGTKYYLSKYHVDRIVVIASPETRQRKAEGKTLDTDERLYCGRSLTRVTSSKRSPTDAELYFDRVSFFWSGVQKKDLPDEINSVRKRELMTIVRGVLRGKGERCDRSEWFDIISRKAYSADIEGAVRADIEASFLTEADYSRYSDAAWAEAERDFREKLDRKITVEDFFSWLDQNGRRLSWLAKEAFCRLYQERLAQWLLEADLHTADAATAMREQAIQYREAIRRLTDELSALKTNRLRRELAYLQRKLFLELAQDRKLVRSADPAADAPVVTVVPDKDIYEIIRHVRGKNDGKLKLLVDVQGGNRTSSYEMNSLLSILKNAESIDCTFTAVNFNVRNYANEIQDETQRYNVADLVAAMNAFITYGRAKQFQTFCAKKICKEEPEVNTLLNYMTKLEDGLVLCSVTEIKENLKQIKAFFAKRKAEGLEFRDAYLRTLQDSIEKDYADIVIENGEIELRSLIDWAIRKSFFQQAITLAEALIPQEIVRSGILYYAGNGGERNKAKNVFSQKHQEADSYERWKFKDLSYYFIKCYCIPSVIRAAFEKTKKNQPSFSAKPPKNDPSILLTALDRANPSTFTQINNMMDRYRDVCDLRNTIAHAASDPVTGGTVRNAIRDFWKAFQKCKQWADQNPVLVCYLTLDDIKK